MDTTVFPDAISRVCLQKLNSLPRTGKPTKDEWTVLSCIVEHCSTTDTTRVISVGTGTKCIGSDQMCLKGLILNDSHAEVMARRGFLRYIYAKMRDSNADTLIYNRETRRYSLKKGTSYHFFSTHPPCGDATVSSNCTTSGEAEPSPKRIKLSTEQAEQFTGAKLLIAVKSTDLLSQDEGAIRTKPGRGVRTLSVSCSDKLSRWNILGIQGGLLDCLLDHPIYLSTYTFCGRVDGKSLRRAIWERWSHRQFQHERFKIQHPKINVSSEAISFEWSQADAKDPSPASIVWCDVPEKSLEVSVAGRRQGVTKSKRNTLTGSLKISKAWLLKDFVSVVSSHPEILESLIISHQPICDFTYGELKKLSKEYQLAWRSVKNDFFQNWTKKPDCFLDFKLDSKS